MTCSSTSTPARSPRPRPSDARHDLPALRVDHDGPRRHDDLLLRSEALMEYIHPVLWGVLVGLLWVTLLIILIREHLKKRNTP